MFGDDEAYYARAAEEIASREVRPGLWAKALAETGCDEPLARARYLKLRVKTMKAEVAAAGRLVREQERAMRRRAEEQAEQPWTVWTVGSAVLGLFCLAVLLGWGWRLLEWLAKRL